MTIEQAARMAIDAASAKRLVSEVIARLPPEVPFDARRVLAEHPDLKANRSAVLDIAYEEFCRRTAAGENISADEFAQRFSGVERSLLDLLAVHRYLEETPSLFPHAADLDWPAPPETFLGFELQQELGRGAFSRVFLAREPSLGNRTVVVKVCQRGGREAQVLGRLEHPNIVPVHSVRHHESTGLSAICMPFLGTATLYDVLDAIAGCGAVPDDDRLLTIVRPEASTSRGTSYVDAVVQIGAKLAEALHFAHSRGICHGDIKPSNVLMTDRGAMLLDFNLAYWASGAEPNEIGGTLPYMAPEQLRALVGHSNGTRPDVRSDMYSLGMVLYELLTGELPFGRIYADRPRLSAAADLLERQREGPRRLRELNPRVGCRLARLVEGCLAFQPVDRPESAGSLASALNTCATGAHTWAGLRQNWIAGAAACILVSGAVLMTSGSQFRSRNAGTTHDPVSIPLTSEADAAIQKGDLNRVVELAGQVLESNSEQIEARFLRGHAFLELHDYAAAAEDFERISARVRDGRVAAALAYSYARQNRHLEAADAGEQALEAGFSTPAVLNNLGYCYCFLSDLARAQERLEAALQTGGTLQGVHHNLALVYFRQAVARDTAAPQKASMALEQIEAAAQQGPDSPDLSRDLAYILAFHSQLAYPEDRERSHEYAARALKSARAGVQQGLKPASLRPVLTWLTHDPEIREQIQALTTESPKAQSQETVLLVNPLGNLSSVAPAAVEVRE